MDRQDRMEMQRALETAPTGQAISWRNPDNGNQYSIKPTRTYYNNEQPCREYITHAVIGGLINKSTVKHVVKQMALGKLLINLNSA